MKMGNQNDPREKNLRQKVKKKFVVKSAKSIVSRGSSFYFLQNKRKISANTQICLPLLINLYV
jgi:hypothetical protein